MIAKSIEFLFTKVLESYQHRFVSRRLILSIDLVIVTFSFLLACTLRFNFNFDDIPWRMYQYFLLILLLVRSAFFIFYRSYYGIVRHTSMEDIKIIFQTVSSSTLMIASFSGLVYYFSGNVYLYIPVSVLLIEYFICLFLLIASRFFVKSMYVDIMKGTKRQSVQSVIIYGAGSLGIITKNALLQEAGKYEIKCFIDDNPTLTNNSVEGVRVFDLPTALQRFVEGQGAVPQIILAVQSISSARKKELAELFLKYNIVMRIVPSTIQWMNGTFNSEQIRNIKIEDLLEREQIILHDENIRAQITGKRIMITGAAGSIGSELTRQISVYAPAELYLLDQSESGLYDLEFDIQQNLDKKTKMSVHSVVCDVKDVVRMHTVFEEARPEIVFHTAAYKHVPLMEKFPYEAVKTNVLGTKTVADLSAKFKVEEFVFVSTDKAVNPTNVMGASKRLAEIYLQDLNSNPNIKTRYIVTRFGNVLGSNGSVVPLFKKQIQAGGPVTVTHPEIIRYFMTISEACQLVLEAGAMGMGGEIFVFDMGEAVRIQDLARKMIQLSGYIVDKDISISYTGLRPGEKLYEELLADHEHNIQTHHPKIMIARMQPMDLSGIREKISLLSLAMQSADAEQIVALLKACIPEFISNNSVFEKLDIKPDHKIGKSTLPWQKSSV
ncbi:UDP-N-acetyl-alpha-D-glucosamine C6 dehydratase [Dyadobacter sp. CECT 9275]|uniref:UDP-N-acetyl-alpha-D-glucosamine C6 dehydratase n=1 Tax=Dyadobacter helix TaxID=2822344 RepID=A0A916JGA3_9BACT|nr:nucleoside-diphosphate sugar epimerase/dehydratase [Dyadobacter sp. CECT 9275]CAG5009947.1 UDP-N-acetyl-alpha-D-glucosamine C6 dehydratase [Dyadobacter sp. CECT 9275]